MLVFKIGYRYLRLLFNYLRHSLISQVLLLLLVILIAIVNVVSFKSTIHVKSKCSCRGDINGIVVADSLLNKPTCDLYNVLRRGPGQKVISYSLYGTNSIYYTEIGYLSKLVKKHFPEWVIRIHHDDSINSSVICEYECLRDQTSGILMDNIDFCNITEIPRGHLPAETWNAEYLHSMKWRFLPIGDPFVDLFMSRDLDSWIIDREVDAVQVWLNSNKLFHIMRDNPVHDVPMLGGMWSYANHRSRRLGFRLLETLKNKTIAKSYKENDKKGRDQDFLADYFWPVAKADAVIHDSYTCDRFGGEGFPTKRPDSFCFVPCAKCCDRSLNNMTWAHVCPEKCRPQAHKDWIYC